MTRALKPLADPTTQPRLAEALRLVRGEGPTSAYKAMLRTPREA